MKQPVIRPTLTIRLKRPLQDYLRYVMGLEWDTPIDQPLIASKNSYLGRLVTPFLDYRPCTENPLLPGKFPDCFTFGLPLYDDMEIRRNTAWISEKNQVHIQKILEYHFRLHFRLYADDKVRYIQANGPMKGSIKKIIIQFCEDTNILFDDITFDMVSKGYYRSRQKSLKYTSLASKRMTIGYLFHII